jgi:hypothetical protein
MLFALDGVKDDSGFIESLQLDRKARHRILGDTQNLSEQIIKRYQSKFDDMQVRSRHILSMIHHRE